MMSNQRFKLCIISKRSKNVLRTLNNSNNRPILPFKLQIILNKTTGSKPFLQHFKYNQYHTNVTNKVCIQR